MRALGFDRIPDGSAGGLTFVTSLDSITGVSPTQAPAVPPAIVAALVRAGLQQVQAGWDQGGRIWLRYAVPGSNGVASGQWGSESYRRDRVRQALVQAAAAVGPMTTFGLPDQTVVPMVGLRTLELQQTLARKGFSPGTVDGRWGQNTSGALRSALNAAGFPSAMMASTAADAVYVAPAAAWQAVTRLPDRAVAVVQPSSPTAPIVPPPSDNVDWIPWLIAGSVVGVGGFMIYRHYRRRAIAANRRRV